ncbi:MAG: hypothetical protein Q8Q89_05330 [bacterium]|nr:hypothetical protein [bacterium]
MSDDLKTLIKNIAILFAVLVLAYFVAVYFGNFYVYFFPQSPSGGSFFSAPKAVENFLLGFPLSYIFFLFLLFTAFGGAKKYWWIGILLIPAIIFEVYFDLSHIYFPILLALAGWLLGLLIHKIFAR